MIVIIKKLNNTNNYVINLDNIISINILKILIHLSYFDCHDRLIAPKSRQLQTNVYNVTDRVIFLQAFIVKIFPAW